MTVPSTREKPAEWKLADLIDLEVLVSEDERAPAEEAIRIRERDLGIRREIQSGLGSGALINRKTAFSAWLESRRKARFRSGPSPGEEVVSWLFWVRAGLFLAGFATARAAVWSFFRNPEIIPGQPEPINVLGYALVCVGLPLLLTLYGFWIYLGQSALPRLPAPPALLRGAVFDLLRPLLRRAARRVSRQTATASGLEGQVLIGAIQQRLASRRSAIAAALFQVVQAFGVAFTAGVLAWSWLDCTLQSRVFGWQTTNRQLTPEIVYRFVKGASLPWSWLRPEGEGFPTLREIEQTRFLRYHALGGFSMEAASAWATFLIAAAFIYGFLPRFLLERLSARHARKALAAESFDELRFDPLWDRLSRPAVEWPGGGAAEPGPALGGELAAPRDGNEGTDLAGPVKLILPEDVFTPERAAAIREWFQRERGWIIKETDCAPLAAGLDAKEKLASELSHRDDPSLRLRIVLVQESFMPPVQGSLSFFRSLRAAAGGRSSIHVALLGKPDGHPLGKAPARIEFEIWKKRVTAMGDPNIEVFPLASPE